MGHRGVGRGCVAGERHQSGVLIAPKFCPLPRVLLTWRHMTTFPFHLICPPQLPPHLLLSLPPYLPTSAPSPSTPRSPAPPNPMPHPLPCAVPPPTPLTPTPHLPTTHSPLTCPTHSRLLRPMTSSGTYSSAPVDSRPAASAIISAIATMDSLHRPVRSESRGATEYEGSRRDAGVNANAVAGGGSVAREGLDNKCSYGAMAGWRYGPRAEPRGGCDPGRQRTRQCPSRGRQCLSTCQR